MQTATKNRPSQARAAKAAAQANGKQTGNAKLMLSNEAKSFIEKPSTEHGISLKDRVLLAIKDGAEHLGADVFKQLQDQVPAELVVEKPMTADAKELKTGRLALLAAALDLLKKAKRLTVKGTTADGEWDGGAKIKLVPPAPDERFDIDHEFKNLLPPQLPGEVAELERQILTEGCRVAVTVWENGNRTLLADGHTRSEICLRHGIEYEINSISLPGRQAVREWIWNQHYGRRNLTGQAESYLRGRRFNAIKQRGGDTRSKEPKAQNALLKKTAGGMAQEYKVSRATILRDGKFAVAVDTIIEAAAQHGEEFRHKLLSRSIRLTDGKVRLLADKGKGEIVQLVKKLLAGEKIEPGKLSSGKGNEFLRIALSRGKPTEQAQTLLKELGRQRFGKLVEEMNQLVQADGSEKSDGEKGKEAGAGQEA